MPLTFLRTGHSLGLHRGLLQRSSGQPRRPEQHSLRLPRGRLQRSVLRSLQQPRALRQQFPLRKHSVPQRHRYPPTSPRLCTLQLPGCLQPAILLQQG